MAARFMTKTIAIVDYHQGGHHLMYLRLFAKTLLTMNYRVMVFCQEPEAVQQWIQPQTTLNLSKLQTFQIKRPDIFKIPLLKKTISPLNVLHRWQHTSQTIQQAVNTTGYAPDIVFFNWLDSYFSYYLVPKIIQRVFPYRWSGLYFQPGELKHQQHRIPLLNRSLHHYALARSSQCIGIGVLNAAAAKQIEATIRHPVLVFPDITDETEPDPHSSVLNKIKHQAKGRKIITLIGGLSKRKGLLTLIKTAQQASQRNLFFAFIGKLSSNEFSSDEIEQLKSIIQTAQSNCLFHFKRIPTEAQFNAIINGSDILYAAYEDFPFSSNILTKAAVFKKPIIVSSGFVMEQRVNEFEIGVSIPQREAPATLNAIESLLLGQNLKGERLAFRFDRYRQANSESALKAVFAKMMSTL